MAFDQNYIPKDLRPLNIARTVAEETRISPGTSSGRPIEGFFAAAPPLDGSPGTVPTVYYQMADGGLVGVGYGNGMNNHGGTGWAPQVVISGQPQPCVVSAGVVNHGNGFSHMPRAHGNASDQASDEGGEDSASGRKVKFLCSYGGKILPRPSDGVLRYVGGQTRIISVRRDVSFNELVRKMVNMFGESAAIKYQLPEEDLDALISVSCPDDLGNMMEEYEKLCQMSSDGSAKLRVFLFSASEVDSYGIVRSADIGDSHRKYFEAVNGILEGVGVIGATRKESSVNGILEGVGVSGTTREESSVNGILEGVGVSGTTREESSVDGTLEGVGDTTGSSEFSGADVIDSCVQGNGEINGPPSTGWQSPKESSVYSQEATPKNSLINQGIHMDNSASALGIPVMPGPPPTIPTHMDHEVERSAAVIMPHNHGIEMQQPGVTFPVSSPYIPSYGDLPQEPMTRAEYVHYPSCQGYPAQIMRTVAPVMQQQQIAPGISPRQFIQAPMPPSSHVSMNPNMVPTLIQTQQFQPVENTPGQRVVQVPVAYNSYQAQFSPQVFGGGYGWHQVPHQEQLVFSEGWMQNQNYAVSENATRFEGCNLCQKALPHPHSDTISQDQKQNNMSDIKLGPYILQLEGKGKSEERTGTIGDHGEMAVGQHGTSSQLPQAGKTQVEMMIVEQNLTGNFIDDGYVPRKEDNSEKPIPHGVLGLTSGLKSPIGMVTAAVPQTYQDTAVPPLFIPMQYQIRQDAVSSRPTNEYHPTISAISSPLSHNQFFEQPKHCYSNISSMVPKVDNQDSAYDYQRLMERGIENLQIHPAEIIQNIRQDKLPADSMKREDVQENGLPIGGDGENSWSTNFGDHYTALGGNQPNQIKILPVSASESPYPHNVRPTESHEVAQCSFISDPFIHFHGKPDSYTIQDEINTGDVDYSSNSLFSHQDPWNFQQDTHLPPPKPKLIHLKKDFDTSVPAGVMHQTDENQFLVSNDEAFITERWLENGINEVTGNVNADVNSESVQSNKGSDEEFIKQELQAVVEGVAASVFQSPADIQQNTDVQVEIKEHFEDVEATRLEKMNLFSPLSEGFGRLQIVNNTDLEELRELGSGTFGTVYHGKWRGTDVAIKRINDRCFAGKPSEQERMRDDFWNEAIKLADLHHPNVVAFYGIVLDGPGGSVATVTEYMVNGSLRTALQKKESRNLDKRKRLLIAMDVAFGMEYLHGKNIVHFDLKSDNLLVNLRDPHRPICKVGDLGLSKVKCKTLISGGVRGTLPWMAPELLNGSSSLVSEKVDVYSFGIILWELLTGEEPYTDLHYGAIIGGIVSNTLRPSIPETCDPDWKSLMERCWSSEPPERPNFTEIANLLRTMASKIPAKGQTQQQPLPQA